jgi:hypothetical protein
MTPDSATETRIYREQALDELNIGKTTFYKWVNYLELEQRQDSAKRKYLDESQFNQLQVLQAYYLEHGKIEGFLPTENLTEHPGQLATVESKAIATNDEPAPLATGNIYVEPETPTAGMDIDRLVREAAELKARNLAMGDLVKLSIAQNMTFEDLDPDLQAKVTAAHNAANPKDTPASIASQLLAQYRSGKKSQNPPA